MTQRVVNTVLSLASLAVLVAWPLRALLLDEFSANDRGDSARFFCFVMAGLFGALALVFGFRAIKAGAKTSD